MEEHNRERLLKNQVMEELKFNCQNELRQHHIDFEGLKHNYDRKELVL